MLPIAGATTCSDTRIEPIWYDNEPIAVNIGSLADSPLWRVGSFFLGHVTKSFCFCSANLKERRLMV